MIQCSSHLKCATAADSGYWNDQQLVSERVLTLDMGGFAALKSDGSVVTIVWGEPTTERPVVSARQRDIALSVGSEQYPVLARLLPKREAESKVRPICGGTGKHPLVEQAGLDNIVCSCGGLGWLPDYWEPV